MHAKGSVAEALYAPNTLVTPNAEMCCDVSSAEPMLNAHRPESMSNVTVHP